MHFVKKVPTTDEEKALKEKERAVKVKAYCALREQIFEKRRKGELDLEMMAMTSKLLEKNPDIYTLWNIRRDTLEKLIGARKPSGDDEDGNKKKKKELINFLKDELYLTKSCLEANPKSYSAWFQRGWTLKKQVELDAEPDFNIELILCKKALAMDCRNFHCWDHRRVVARFANLPADEELSFSNKLLDANFSNYSAWHYRATLLPRIVNETTGTFKISDEIVMDEMNRTKNASFTDPEDQSAWVYTRWLLEVGSNREWLRPDSLALPVPLSITFNGTSTTIVMSKACTLDVLLNFVDGDVSGPWVGFSALCRNPMASRIWKLSSDKPINARLNEEDKWNSVESSPEKWLVNANLLKSAHGVNTPQRKIADTIADDCKQLLDVEPNSVWALYIYTLCLIESKPIVAHLEIMENLTRMETLDSKRKEVYRSLKSRQIISHAMASIDNERTLLERIIDGTENRFSLRYNNLTSVEALNLLSGFLVDVDLSGNQISSIDDLILCNLTHLTLNENPIKSLKPVPALRDLTFLSVASCPIAEVNDILPALQCMKLGRFVFPETPLSNKTAELGQSLEKVRLIPHWM